MQINSLGYIDAAIISDIHIRDRGDDKHQTFISLLQELGRCNLKHLFLLGDIFDFCLGRSQYFHKKFNQVGEEIEKLTSSGVRTVFLEGNHEFDAKFLPWQGVEFIFEGDHIFELPTGQKLLMAHGDLVYSHRMYKAFRGFVKTRLVKSVASLLPGPWMDNFALGNAHVSRAADEYRSLDDDDVKKTMARWADQYECDHAFFGHLHYPYAFPREKGGWIASCGSWDQPTIILIKGDQLYRSEFELNATEFTCAELKKNLGVEKDVSK